MKSADEDHELSMRSYQRGTALALAGTLAGAGLALWASQPPARASASPATASGSTSTIAACRAGQPTVTVDGYGAAKGSPNEMTLLLGVHTLAPTAVAAMASNATKAQALIGVLVTAGVPKAQVQTSNLSVNANYNQKGQISGYQVDNDLTVTLLGAAELGKAGQVIDAAGRAAGNAVRVNGISFSLSNNSALMAQARQQAVRQARAQATAMASAANETLGPLCSLQDQSQPSTYPPPNLVMPAASVPAPTTPVEPGSEQVSAQVEAVFALQPG
ncbi:MAG: SIMPL domain-containing protein [Acidimicrobiales bacterium]